MRVHISRLLSVLAVSLALFCVRQVTAPGAAAITYPVTDYKVQSGMRVVLETSPDDGTAGVVLFVSAGSADEPRDKAGLAHLVEHLVFDTKHGASSYERKLEALAGAYNGFTNWDDTTYYAFGPAQNLPAILDAMAQLLAEPLAGVDEKTFEHERQIVQNERQLGDDHMARAFGLLASEVFPDEHPYAHPVGGTDDTIKRLTLADALAFAKTYYTASRSVITVSSPLASAKQRALVDKAFAGAPRADAPRRPGGPDPLVKSKGPMRTCEAPVWFPALWIGWSLPPGTDTALLASDLLGTRWSEIYDHDHDVVGIRAWTAEGTQATMLYVVATLKNGDHPDSTAESIVYEATRAIREGQRGTTLDIYKRIASTYLIDEEEPIVSRTVNLALSTGLWNKPMYRRTRAERTMAVDTSTVRDQLQKYVTEERAHAVLVRPSQGGTSTAASVEQAALALDSPPGPAPSSEQARAWMRTIGVGDAKRTKLDNGLEVVVVARPGSPFHTVAIAYRGGSGDERTPGAAIASTWAKWHHGASAMLGVRYDDRVGDDVRLELLHATGKNLELTFEQLKKEREFRTEWPPYEFKNLLENLKKQDQSPAQVLHRKLRAALFGTHPYGRTPTSADIAKIKGKDVYRFIDSARRPDNELVVIVGDIDPTEALRLVQSSWLSEKTTRAAAPREQPPAVIETSEARKGSRVIVQDRPGSNSTEMRLMCFLPRGELEGRGARALFARAVQNVLFDELRRRTASSYTVNSEAKVLRGGTAWLQVWADIDPAHLGPALDTIHRILAEPPANWLDDQALGHARASVARGLNLGFGTTEALAREIVGVWNVEWPVESLDAFPDRVLAATAEQTIRVADHCQKNFVIGLLGNEVAINAALATRELR